MVLNTQPGEEAQVDFGYIGLLNINGKKKKAWIFVMTLSYSRYMYVQIVLDQKVQTFINCHKNVDNPDFIKQLYEYFFLNKCSLHTKQ